MSDIAALQGRILTAIDRIGQGLEALEAKAADEAAAAADTPDLAQQLEDEKLANAQLEERVKSLSARVKDAEAASEASVSAQTQAASERKDVLRRLDAELQALRLANQQLRDNNAALREANTTGVVEPHLINKAMMAELDGLRATRSADRAEIDLIMADLMAVINDGDGPETTQAEDA